MVNSGSSGLPNNFIEQQFKKEKYLKLLMTSEQKQLYKKIDEILWKEWDPIGVNDIDDVRDEYQSYTPHIFSLTIHGADKIEIAEHLFKLETVNMGMTGNKNHCEDVAQKIINAEG